MLDGVIVIAAFILNPRARKRREREAQRAALDTTVAQANVTQPLSLSPTIVEEVEDGRRTSEKELVGGSRTSPADHDEERKEM